jgi:hypothetical protein
MPPLFIPVVGIGSTPPRKPFNPQRLISHLTNSNGCGNLRLKVLLKVSPLPPSFLPQPSVYPPLPIPLFPLLTTHHSPPTFRHPLFSYTYELPLPSDRFAAPLFSNIYELPFPQLLCFDKHLRCPIVFFAPPRNSACSANSVVNRPLTPLLTYCCGLFVVAKRIKSFAIKQIQTLSQNTRGGVSPAPSGHVGGRIPTDSRPSHPEPLPLRVLAPSASLRHLYSAFPCLSTFNCRLSTSLPQC